MGMNKRYPGHSIGLSIEEVAVRPQPIGLTAEELDLEHDEVITPKQPVPARSFVRFYEATIRPDVEAIAWTRSGRHVKVRWTMQNGTTREVWVWASAVDRRPPREK